MSSINCEAIDLYEDFVVLCDVGSLIQLLVTQVTAQRCTSLFREFALTSGRLPNRRPHRYPQMSHDRARNTLAPDKYIHAACMSFLISVSVGLS